METTDNYELLFRSLPIMATAIGPHGRYIDVNDIMLSRLGYESGEMVGHRPADFVTPDSARRIDEEFLPTLRRTGLLINKPVGFLARDGNEVRCLTNAAVIGVTGDDPALTVAVYSDLSEQARADFNYRQLYRSTPAMLHTVDSNGLIMTVTDHWLSRMGYRREDVIGRSIKDFFSEEYLEQLHPNRLQDLISAGEYQNEERQMVTRQGKTLDVVSSAISEKDDEGNVRRMLVASKDVTARNRAERELRETLVENAKLREELQRERDYLREEVNVGMNFGRIIGDSPALKHMLAQIEAVAGTPANVLVVGESGVGKELVAHAIHSRSARADSPLVKVNCASIPKELFESEFFGHVKGAFTGAQRDRVGRFQLAHGGTIFLDEVGEIPLELQGKLLRVLQEREFERVGDDRTRTVDVRVIAATNRDLETLVSEGRFREDLYYRLSVFPLLVPPLRRRQDDVMQLAQHFLDKTCRDFGREPMRLTRSQATQIRGYDWPGNVRELKNLIERAVILATNNVPRLEINRGVPQPAAGKNGGKASSDEDGVLTEIQMKEFRRKNILKALDASAWKVSGTNGAAALLGVKPTTLADRMKALGIKKPAL